MRSRASSGLNHAARSTSGTMRRRPERGRPLELELVAAHVPGRSRPGRRPRRHPACRRAGAPRPGRRAAPRRADRRRAPRRARQARGRGRLFAVVELALGDRPRPEVALGPERSAGVDEQDLDAADTLAVEQDPGARLGHPRHGSRTGATMRACGSAPPPRYSLPPGCSPRSAATEREHRPRVRPQGQGGPGPGVHPAPAVARDRLPRARARTGDGHALHHRPRHAARAYRHPGRFEVSFGAVEACGGFEATASGSRGSRASIQFSTLAC